MSYDDVLAALADRTRRSIFESLNARPQTVSELAAHQTVSRPAVSQHLKVLGEAKLIELQRLDGRMRYRLRCDGLVELRRYLDGFWSDVLESYHAEIVRRLNGEPEETES